MDIFEFAMKAELDGERFYREMAEKAPQPGMRLILGALADDEILHYRILEQAKTSHAAKLEDSPALATAKNIFAKLKEEGGAEFKGGEIDLYRQAQALEKKSEEFYREKAGEVRDENQKKLLLSLAEQEQKHGELLESMIEYLSTP